jgi:hypothetical protein
MCGITLMSNTSGLDHQDSVLVPTTLVDACDGLGVTVDDETENEGTILEGDDGFSFGEHLENFGG